MCAGTQSGDGTNPAASVREALPQEAGSKVAQLPVAFSSTGTDGVCNTVAGQVCSLVFPCVFVPFSTVGHSVLPYLGTTHLPSVNGVPDVPLLDYHEPCSSV